jgi:hypothetical protein
VIKLTQKRQITCFRISFLVVKYEKKGFLIKLFWDFRSSRIHSGLFKKLDSHKWSYEKKGKIFSLNEVFSFNSKLLFNELRVLGVLWDSWRGGTEHPQEAQLLGLVSHIFPKICRSFAGPTSASRRLCQGCPDSGRPADRT